MDPGFQVRGRGVAHLKKLRRAEEGAKMFGVFHAKNHDFTQKNHIFSQFRGGASRVRPPPPGSAPGQSPSDIYKLTPGFLVGSVLFNRFIIYFT